MKTQFSFRYSFYHAAESRRLAGYISRHLPACNQSTIRIVTGPGVNYLTALIEANALNTHKQGCRNRLACYPGTQSGSSSGTQRSQVLSGTTTAHHVYQDSLLASTWVPTDSTWQIVDVIMTRRYNTVGTKSLHFSLSQPTIFL